MDELTEQAEKIYDRNIIELRVATEAILKTKKVEQNLEATQFKLMLIADLLCQARNNIVANEDIQELKDIVMAAYKLSQKS